MRGRPEVYRTLWTDGQDCQNQGLTTSHRPKTILFTQSISSLIPKMSVFTLAIACLTKSYLTWFIELTFQIPMQYCSLQCWTLLPSPDTTTVECCFGFGLASSFLLELVLHSFPVAYWAPTDLGSSSFSVISFCLFISFTGFSRQEYWSGLPFPTPVDCILSGLSTTIHLSWVALHGMAHSFIELHRAVIHVITLPLHNMKGHHPISWRP